MCDVSAIMSERGVSVALLQEPYVSNGCVRGLPVGWCVYVCENGPVRSAVIVKDACLESMCVRECTDEYGVCVWLKGDFGEMYVVSVYCRHGHDIEPYMAYMDRVCMYARGKRVIIGMDANAVSPLWYSKGGRLNSESDMRGRLLEEWILTSGMIVMNEPSEYYTFEGMTGQSDIDVTLVSESCAGCRIVWEIKNDWSISDHNAILIEICMDVVCVVSEVYKRWSCQGADWEGYMCDLRECANVCDYNVCEDVNEEVEKLMSWVQVANRNRLKEIKVMNDGKIKWWTKELSRMKKCVRKSRRVWQRAKRTGNESVDVRRNEYSRLLKEYKRMLWNVKEESWKRFVSGSSNLDPWGPVYRICRGKHGRSKLGAMRVGGRLTGTWNESVRVLMSKFFPVSRAGDLCVNARCDGSVRKFEWNEVNDAVRMMKLRKAPGLDGVNAEMLRAIWAAIPECLMRVYDVCLRTSRFPDEWKRANVIALLKSPEKVRTDPASYRPISLLSVLGKTLERMMVKRVECKVRDSMCDAQHGFRRGRSVETAWMRVKECVCRSERKYVLGVFVDFKGAFDNLEWNRVIERLSAIGCEEIGLWKDYFKARKACMIGVSEVVWKDVECGCPQGSVCGPFVWNLMMDGLLWELIGSGCECVAYADDLLLLIEGNSRVELERKGTECMRIVSEWGANVGVGVSEEKTVMTLLKGSLAGTRRPAVRVYGKQLKYSETVKYLGVWMSVRMRFKVHLEYIRKKITNVVGQMKRVMKCEWGMKKRALRIVYKGLFVASVMYGASVWYGMMEYEYARDLLNRCQRIAMYACLNVCRTVSTEAMQVLMGGLPWDLECVRRGVLFKIRNGVELNEKDVVSNEDVCGRTWNECKRLVSERLYDKWQNRWNSSVNGRVTYEYIRNVRFAERNVCFDPGTYVCYLLTGHGSMNAFLKKRGLCENEGCRCGAVCEDWKHVLVECPLYDDVRNLSECGVCVNDDGCVDVSGVLECKEKYERFCKYAVCVFRRRMSDRRSA
ncbi:Retrovirus-related Pol polyprotein from type-1 retrotransposable element R1 (Fragment) [Anthophora quadrimaculata]